MINVVVDEYTTPSPFTVAPDASLTEVIGIMKENDIRHVPVVDNESPIGIISDRDLQVLAIVGGASDLSAKDIMTTSPYKVNADWPLQKVALEMSRQKIGSAIVTDDEDKLVGIFTSTDALNALVEVLREESQD